jgi:hypothetical protein
MDAHNSILLWICVDSERIGPHCKWIGPHFERISQDCQRTRLNLSKIDPQSPKSDRCETLFTLLDFGPQKSCNTHIYHFHISESLNLVFCFKN